MKKQLFILLFAFGFAGCIGGGTLGGFELRIFPTSKKN